MRNQTSTLIFFLLLFPSLLFAQTGWQYLSPQDGSKFINPENTIVLRHGGISIQAQTLSKSLSVTGSLSGLIKGELKLANDGRTFVFYPGHPFKMGEEIAVKVSTLRSLEKGTFINDTSFSFMISKNKSPDFINSALSSDLHLQGDSMQNIEQSSSLNQSAKGFPHSDIDTPDDFPGLEILHYTQPAPGYFLISTPSISGFSPYIQIIDPHGTPVFYREYDEHCSDFKFTGQNKLMHFYGSSSLPASKCYYILNNHYQIIDTLKMQNGYMVDSHEGLLLENGNTILMAYDAQIVGMDTVVNGGSPFASVVGLVIQETDSSDNVIFQWRSWDHFAITDAYAEDLTTGHIDCVHGNSLEIDNDGHLLLSSRHLNEITKINRNTGAIIWRFGPKALNNMFTFTNDTVGFTYQHDARRLANGNLTLYDNGNLHDPLFSQAIEYELDEENLTASRVWNYINDPAIFAPATGSTRRLPNGNTLIGWGSVDVVSPNFTEVDANNQKCWEAILPDWVHCYRVLKGQWKNQLLVPDKDTLTFESDTDNPPILPINLYNDADYIIKISSAHHHHEAFQLITPLPLSIPAKASAELFIEFNPGFHEGEIRDVFTFNYDSIFEGNLAQRIACQVNVQAVLDDELAPQMRAIPVNGSYISNTTFFSFVFSETVFHPDSSYIQSNDLSEIISLIRDSAGGNPVGYKSTIDTWKRKITLIPDTLLNNKTYLVHFTGHSFADKNGQVLEQAQDFVYYVSDSLEPKTLFIPANGSNDVVRDITVQLHFDEQIFKTDGSEITNEDLPAMLVFKNDTLNGSDVSFEASISTEKNTIKLYPNNWLESYQQYYIALRPHSIQDEFGNVQADTLWAIFTTGNDLGIGNYSIKPLKIYPNPNDGIFRIESESATITNYQVYSLIAGLIHQETGIDRKYVDVDLKELTSGIYFIKTTVRLGKKTIAVPAKKFLISR